MKQYSGSWTVIDRDAGILAYEYAFGSDGATANTFVARMSNNKLVVISPPFGSDSHLFEDLAQFGEVGALVANNGFHHLGLAEWKARYPDARAFGDPLAKARIEQKNREAPDLEPLEALIPLLGDTVHLTSVPRTKCAETWAWAKGRSGYIWFTGDTLANLPHWPKNFFFRLLFKATGTKLGFGVFHTAMKFMVNDKKGALRLLRAEMDAHPPAIIVPGHGGILDDSDLARKTDELLAAAI